MSENKIFMVIAEMITNNDVVIFMKGTKTAPQCGFSSLAVKIMQTLEVEFLDINIFDNPKIRQGIKDYSDWPTIPQIYLKGEFIGGSDILRELFETKKLMTMLSAKHISYKQ